MYIIRGSFLVKVSRLFLLFLSILCLVFLPSCSNPSEAIPEDISAKLLRFHVIANSDSPDDQALKLEIRDRILNEIGPKLESSKTKEEAMSIIKGCIPSIKMIAEDEIKSDGKNYGVSVSLGRSSFPAKSYSGIVLPAGVYDALKITLGQGGGKNWWCVMFPPLCFVDISHSLTSDEAERRMKAVLSDDEYDSILSTRPENSTGAVKKPLNKNNSSTVQPTENNAELKFKSVEIVKSIIQKLESIFSKK